MRSVEAAAQDAILRATITRASQASETARAFKKTLFRLVVAALVFSAFAVWAFVSVNGILKRQLRSELEVQRESTRAALELWADGILHRLEVAAADPRLAEGVRARVFPEALTHVVEQTGSFAALITDAAGVTLLASPELAPGVRLPYAPREIQKWLAAPEARLWSPAFFSTKRGARPFLGFSSPIRDNGKLLGVVHLLVDPAARFSEILSLGRVGDTGETYAFDRDGHMISSSRFDDDLARLGLVDGKFRSAILAVELRDPGVSLVDGGKPAQPRSQQPLTAVARGALASGPGTNVDGYRDYRGVLSVGAWDFLPRYGFGFTTEMDFDEAFELRRALGNVLAVLLGLLVVALLFLVWEGHRNLQLSARSLRAERRAERLGQYTLGRKLGEGGMGAVYEARHAMLRRPTAVKLIKPPERGAVTPERFARFEREVQLTAELTHPNTIAIYDYGKTPDGVLYYAMEYLAGVDLEKLIARSGPLPVERAGYLMAQACGSLAEAHARGFIHRDVKPSNLMVCERGGEFDCVKVLDFGLVKSTSTRSASSSLTGVGAFAGTPHYMSPESLTTPERAKPSADVYALGAVLYFLISGRDLFPGRESMSVMVAQISEEPPRIETLVPSIPPAVADLIHRCLCKDPEARPADAHELARALRATFPSGWSSDRAQDWWLEHPEVLRAEDEVPRSVDPTGETVAFRRA